MADGEKSGALANRTVAMHVTKAIDCLIHYYDGLLGQQDEVTFALDVLGTEGWALVDLESPKPLTREFICQSAEIKIERRRSIEAWREGLPEHALEIVKDVHSAFNSTSPELLEAARTAIAEYTART